MANMYEQWDKQLADTNTDYDALAKQMLSAAQAMASVDVELYWRLAAALYNSTNNMYDTVNLNVEVRHW